MSPDQDQGTDKGTDTDGQEGEVSELAMSQSPQQVSTEDPAADQPKDGTGGVHEGDGDSHPR